MLDAEIYDVVVLGAGISGLAAAKILHKEGLKTLVLEARERNGGRIHTIRSTYKNGTNATIIDLGASYLHGCVNSQLVQPLFTLASRLGMPTVTAPGDVLGPHRGWECPEVAKWRDPKTGDIIGIDEVAEMSFLLDRCLVHILMMGKQNKTNNTSTLADALNTSLDVSLRLLFKAGQRESPTLTSRERGIFDSLFARYIAYVNPSHRLSSALSLGPHYEADAAAMLAFDTDHPSALAKRLYLDWLQRKCGHLATHRSLPTVARRVEHKWEDRLVLQGFDRMIDFLATDIDIRHCCVVRYIDWSSVTSTKLKSNGVMQRGSEPVEGLIYIEASPYTEDGQTPVLSRLPPQRYLARYCIITVPVGVLKCLDRRSSIRFHPPLPAYKRVAIDRLGIPKFGADTHNKVVLQFQQSDVFWDQETPQLVCPGARLHILNCDYFGQAGVLVAHLWGGSKLRIFNRPDSAVVKELLDLLSGMYPDQCPLPEPVFTQVTRWSEDPFSLGAYTAGEIGSGDADRHAYASSLPSADNPRVLFAGEATVDSSGGQQCTHGAFASGVSRALDILDHIQGGRCRLRDMRIVDYLTGFRMYNHQPHTMVRRAMKRHLEGASLRIDGLFPIVHKPPETLATVRKQTRPDGKPSKLSLSSDNLAHSITNETLELPNSLSTMHSRRRSNRWSTKISTQASASLYASYKMCEQKGSNFSGSSSTSSLTSFKDDFPSSDSPEHSHDSAGEEECRTGSKFHSRPATCHPPATVLKTGGWMHTTIAAESASTLPAQAATSNVQIIHPENMQFSASRLMGQDPFLTYTDVPAQMRVVSKRPVNHLKVPTP